MQLRTAIVDDEILARQLLEDYVAKIDALELCISSGNPLEFSNYLQSNEVDLVFLDIDMPELTGIGLLRSMTSHPKVILTTAHSEYALESYDYGVTDYLLKPIKFERFLKAVNKIMFGKMLGITETVKHQHLRIKHDGIFIDVPLDGILYFKSFGNYLKVITPSRTYLIAETLTNMESSMPAIFQRVHKSYMVNLNYVEKAQTGYLQIGSHEIPVGTLYKLVVKQKLESR